MDQQKNTQPAPENLNLSAFGIPDPPEYAKDQKTVENKKLDGKADPKEISDTDQDIGPEEDDLDEDTDGYQLQDEDADVYEDDEDPEDDTDTDPTDVDLRDAQQRADKAEKKAHDLQSERDKLQNQIITLQAQYGNTIITLNQRLDDLEQQQFQSHPEDPFAGKADEDYITVADAKKIANEASGRQKRNGERRKTPGQSTQKKDDWVYSQPDYAEVQKFINDNYQKLAADPRYFNRSTGEVYLIAQGDMEKEKITRDFQSKMNKQQKQHKNKPRPPRTGGNRPKSKTTVKQKMTPFEEVLRL